MKRIVAYFVLSVFILAHTGISALAQEAFYISQNVTDDVFAALPADTPAPSAPKNNSASEPSGATNTTNEEVFQGHAEVTDRLEEKNKELFTGEIDQLVPKDVIKMTVSQVLSTGYTEEGDEFFAEITNDVEGEKGVILPAGTIAHGTVKEIEGSKRLGRDGWIEVSFDYLITPDGREIPIQGQMSTKLNPVVGTSKVIAKSAGYTAAGGLVGGLLALNIFGLPAAVLSQGYTLAGGAAVGGAVGMGMALYKKGKDVLISQGDEIRVKITQGVDLPVFKKEALKQEEFVCEGLNIKITNIDIGEDPFGEMNTITVALVITNLTDKYFTGFDISMVNDLNASFYPSVFGDTTLMFSKIKPGDRLAGRISFSVDNVKRKHWLVIYDRMERKPVAKISIDNALRDLKDKKEAKKKNKKKSKKDV